MAIAVCVLVAGAGRAVFGARSNDLLQVHGWLAYWISDRANPYADIFAVNYPPHAFVVLSWLGLVPATAAPVLWALLNVVLAPVVSWLFVRGLPLDRAERMVLAAMLTSWGAVLSGLWMGQFTLLSVAFGLFAIRAANRPLLSGVLLACALIKPHVAVVFVFWAAYARRWRMLGAAGAAMLAGLLMMAMWARTSPVAIVESWIAVLSWQFGGASPTAGSTAAWPMLVSWVGAANAGEVRIWGLVIGGLALLGFLRARVASSGNTCLPIALAGALSLAALFHRRYDMILLAPAFCALWLVARKQAAERRWLLPVLLAVHAALVVEIPWAWQVWVGPAAVPDTAWDWIAVNFDRVLVLAVGALVLAFRNEIDLFCGIRKERLQ